MDGISRISFVGDSSTSGIGSGDSVFPAFLWRELVRRGITDVSLTNWAVPGFTTADAASLAHLPEFRRSLGPDALVVIFLGNNELAVDKGRFAPQTHWWRRLLGQLGIDRTGIRLHGDDGLAFRDTVEAQLPTALDQVRANLERTMAAVHRTGARILGIVPVANTAFLRGVGLPNSTWFKRVGAEDRIAARLSDGGREGPRHLRQALMAWEAGDAASALRQLRDLGLETAGPVAPIARHNAAVIEHGLGNSRSALDALDRLADQNEGHRSIHLHDAALIRLALGDVEGGQRGMRESYDSDHTAYQIKPAVRDLLRRTYDDAGVPWIDLADLLQPGQLDFVDYCHPTRALHGRLAQALFDRISTSWHPGSAKPAAYRCRFPSPDCASHPLESLIDYYSIDRHGDLPPPGRNSRIDGWVARARARTAGHPILAAAPAAVFARKHWFEALNFPEFHGHRIVLGYLRVLESRLGGIPGAFCGLDDHDVSADACERRILRLTAYDIAADPYMDRAYADALMALVTERFHKLGDDPTTPDLRIKTILLWYTREAFRFGTHSRPSMLYDRRTVDELLEALIVCYTIYLQVDAGAAAAAEDLARRILRHARERDAQMSAWVLARTPAMV